MKRLCTTCGEKFFFAPNPRVLQGLGVVDNKGGRLQLTIGIPGRKFVVRAEGLCDAVAQFGLSELLDSC